MTFLSPPDASLQRFILHLAAGSHGPPPHLHPSSVEAFAVTRGSLDVRVGRAWKCLNPGDSVSVLAGSVHTYANRSGAEVEVEVTITPGELMRQFFDDLYLLAEAGMLTRTGGLSLPQAAVLFTRHPGAMAIAGIPPVAQSALWSLLASSASHR